MQSLGLAQGFEHEKRSNRRALIPGCLHRTGSDACLENPDLRPLPTLSAVRSTGEWTKIESGHRRFTVGDKR